MRFAPAAMALSMIVAVTASVGYGAQDDPDPRAAALVAEGRSLLEMGDAQGATDAFEAALAVDPAYSDVYLDLAEAARQDGLQGKAIHYYREALARDPENLAALSGEGEAMLEKGAVERARQNLAQLQDLCGEACSETMDLAAALDRGPSETVLTAEVISPEGHVTKN